MFTVKDSQTSRQLSAPKLPGFDKMAHVKLGQNYGLPYSNLSSLTADGAFQRQINSHFRADDFFTLPHPHWNIPYPAEKLGPKSSQNALPGLKQIDHPRVPQEKGFLIFDRCGNHTTYFFSPSFCSPQNPVIAPEDDEKVAARADKLSNTLIEEKWDENYLNDGGEDEMVNDSEEIDALLYSDSDYNDDDDEEEEDNNEVTSTRRISFKIEEGYYHKEKLFDGLIEEVASCDGSSKRQRLLYGGHKKSSSSSSSSSSNYEDYIDLSKREKKVKTREMLKILCSLVPESGSLKDPVTIIEKAIVYLESMKIEAEALSLA